MNDSVKDKIIYRCTVFRSDRKDETYLYLHILSNFDDLPGELQDMFGDPVFVMTLDLSDREQLARVDVVSVKAALKAEGYFLQLPPKIPVEEEILGQIKQ